MVVGGRWLSAPKAGGARLPIGWTFHQGEWLIPTDLMGYADKRADLSDVASAF